MGKKQLVLAFFDTESAADNAVNELKNWDKASKEIKLGSIGILVKDDKGKVKTQKLGARHTGAGAVLGAIAAVIATGGLALIGGAVLGGIVGTFFHKGLGMSKDDLARIDKQLDGGKAAVGVLASDEEAAAVTAKLTELGGKPETHEVTDEAVEQAATAVEAAPADAPAADTPATPEAKS
ncbi:MAG: hypothetical protein EYC68_06060 [Chloroflexota bacterium]|nr:MAG: hypothetical protein EYC68_06060 [Chloroflexota bacterium]